MKNRNYYIVVLVSLALLAALPSQTATGTGAGVLVGGVLGHAGGIDRSLYDTRATRDVEDGPDEHSNVASEGGANERFAWLERGEELVPVAFLPSVLNGYPPIPDPMTLYVHVNDPPQGRTLDTSMYDGDSSYYGFTGEAEWEMTLAGDLIGTEYAYVMYASGGLGEATCDVEILLRHSGSDTTLASWSQAFTAPDQFAPTQFTGSQRGIDPVSQAGDKLILRIRKVGGSAVGVGIWNGQQFGYSGYSNINVPGYAG